MRQPGQGAQVLCEEEDCLMLPSAVEWLWGDRR